MDVPFLTRGHYKAFTACKSPTVLERFLTMLPVAFVVSSVLLALVNAQTCPAPYVSFTPQHTFCLPPNTNCKISKSGVSDADQKIILDTHNTYRSIIAQGLQASAKSGGYFPKASNMVQLVWDTELATIAEKHSEQCVFAHDCTQCRQVARFAWVGQNIYIRKSSQNITQADWKSSIDSWYNEVKDFPVSNINPFNSPSGPMTGHFTQVVWAETVLVGCGLAMYNNMDADKTYMPYAALYTCNYAPGGNVVGPGSKMYQSGNPATACPASYKPSTQFAGLCTK